jgi:hypothetical protein
MPIVPWQCALGDAPPATLAVAATVAIAPPDDSVDTNKIVITGTGSISSFGTTAPLVTKDITFVPSGGAITLVNSAQLVLLGGANRNITTQCFSRFACDGAGHWQEISFASSSGGLFVGHEVHTASGTVTIPPAARQCLVRICGPGGSGPTTVGGGGGGLEKLLTGLTPGNTFNLVVGAAGSGIPTQLTAGTQALPTALTANGGTGPGGGGTATGGDLNVTGGPGAVGGYSLLSYWGHGGDSANPATPGAAIFDWFN